MSSITSRSNSGLHRIKWRIALRSCPDSLNSCMRVMRHLTNMSGIAPAPAAPPVSSMTCRTCGDIPIVSAQLPSQQHGHQRNPQCGAPNHCGQGRQEHNLSSKILHIRRSDVERNLQCWRIPLQTQRFQRRHHSILSIGIVLGRCGQALAVPILTRMWDCDTSRNLEDHPSS